MEANGLNRSMNKNEIWWTAEIYIMTAKYKKTKASRRVQSNQEKTKNTHQHRIKCELIGIKITTEYIKGRRYSKVRNFMGNSKTQKNWRSYMRK